jgi:hypothetical protein
VIPRYDLEQSSKSQHRRKNDAGEGSSKGKGRATTASGVVKDTELERDTTAYQPEVSRKQKMKVRTVDLPSTVTSA